MKKKIALLLALCLMAGTVDMSAGAWKVQAAGEDFTDVATGEIPEGYTAIYDIADLYAIRSNPEGNYILMNDIDMAEATSEGGDYDCGTGWDSIEEFSGTLDGNGHRIIGMHIFGEFSVEKSTSNGIGLFERTLEATIKNLGVVDCNIDVAINVMQDIYSEGSETGIGSIVGISSGNLENCYSSGNITLSKINYEDRYMSRDFYIGGLAGKGYAEIRACFNLCEVNATKAEIKLDEKICVGGICGICGSDYSEGWIKQCYTAENVKGNEQIKIGAICGEVQRFGVLENCSYLKGTASQGMGNEADTPNCVSLSEAQMKNPKLFTGFDFTDTWEIDPYCSYPYPQLKNNRMVKVAFVKLSQKPQKLEYSQGEPLIFDDAVLEITYEDDIATAIPLAAEMLSGYDMTQIGTQAVTVTYGGKATSFEVEVKEIPVSSIIMPRELSLYRSKQQQLAPVIAPENASNKLVTWESSNSSVAGVDANGLVKANAKGTAVITATTANGLQAECAVTVLVPAASIQLSQTSLALKEGESGVLTARILPLESTDTLQWSSANPAVAEVYDGTVVARSAGTTVVSASTASGVKADCTVTVQKVTQNPDNSGQTPGGSDNNEQISGNPDKDEQPEEEEKEQFITAKNITKTYGTKPFSLGAKASGGGKLTYTVENKKVATVNKNGKVTIKGCGETDILIEATANGAYGEAEETITLTVKPKKLKLTSAKSTGKRTITAKWKKDAKASGYIIQCSTDKKFKESVKTFTISKNKTTSKKIPKLKAGKKYYVRACAYAKAYSGKVKGSYSAVKKVTVKK